jgi:CRP/FNR family transcriptional regulator, cyclic AMP receptor protein
MASLTTQKTFDAQAFLDSAGIARTIGTYQKAETIYAQGDESKTVLYLQTGEVTLSVRSDIGRTATVAVIGPGHFFGEGGLAGQPLRMGTATANTSSTVLVIEQTEMSRMLHEQHALSDRFIRHLLSRNIRIEEDLIDHWFDGPEKRLARALLLLARYGGTDKPQRAIPRISRATLADMVGTTLARVDFFMKKFKKLGFIESDRGLTINDSLLTVVLHD